MKYTLLSMVFWLIFNLVFGQNYISESKQWNVRLSSFGSYSTEIFIIEGDSMVDLLDYKKIWVSYDSLNTFHFQGLLREASNVVYYIPPNSSEGILYDFNLEPGDDALVRNIFCGDQEVPIHVFDVDTVEIFGVERKRWHIGNYDYADEFWIEGIGSLYGPLYTSFEYCIVCPYWELLCYYENEALLYTMPGQDECYQLSVGIEENQATIDLQIIPNPVVRGRQLEVQTSEDILNIKIYNASGMLMETYELISGQKINIETSKLKQGVYFMKAETRKGLTITQKILVL